MADTQASEDLVKSLKTKADLLWLINGETKVEGISHEDVRSWMEGIKTNDITPIADVISELETIIKTTKGNEQRQKENLAAQVRDEQYKEQLKFDKEKLDLQLFYEKKMVEERVKKTSENGLQKPNLRLQKLQISKSNAPTQIGCSFGINSKPRFTRQKSQLGKSSLIRS